MSEEFRSLGFYISDHPLNDYGEVFDQLNIISYRDFFENNNGEALIAGTIMSVQEKKSAKGTPFAIVKLSDKQGEFELFLFSEILIENREKLKESESIILTVQKDRFNKSENQRRINVKKIIALEEMINRPYSKVTIELRDDFNIDEIKEIFKKEGQTKIEFIVQYNNKKFQYDLLKTRKFDFKHLKALKHKEYVKKITV